MSFQQAAAHFTFSRTERPLDMMNRLAQQWSPRFGVELPEITCDTPVRRESWTHLQVGEHLDRMVEICPKMVVDKMPRYNTGALILFEYGGHVGQLDGRHRANLWRNIPGQYDVLILEL